MSDTIEPELLVEEERAFARPAAAAPNHEFWWLPPSCLLLTVNQAAALMHCSVDKVLRIPRDQLPCARPGKENLYFLTDVVTYVRKHCGVGQDLEPIASGTESCFQKIVDGVRERSSKGERK